MRDVIHRASHGEQTSNIQRLVTLLAVEAFKIAALRWGWTDQVPVHAVAIGSQVILVNIQ